MKYLPLSLHTAINPWRHVPPSSIQCSKILTSLQRLSTSPNDAISFTIGDGLYYHGYYNVPLDPGCLYRVHVRIVTISMNGVIGNSESYQLSLMFSNFQIGRLPRLLVELSYVQGRVKELHEGGFQLCFEV